MEPRVYELLGLPGSGKTYYLNKLSIHSNAVKIFHAKKISILKILSQIFLPIVISIIFCMFFLQRKKNKNNISTIIFLFKPWLIMSLNYQLVRLSFIFIYFGIFKKNIIIDEGLNYQIIRYKTLYNDEVDALLLIMTNLLSYLNIKTFLLVTPVHICVKRFLMREASAHFNRTNDWKFNKRKKFWMYSAWLKMWTWFFIPDFFNSHIRVRDNHSNDIINYLKLSD